MTAKSGNDGTTDAKPPTDWEAIEREYRGGMLSLAEIGRRYGVSHVAIVKRAKKREWTRDLSEKVKREIAARMVTEGLREPREAVTIKTLADRGVNILTGQRNRIGRASDAVTKLIEELHETTDYLPEIEQAIDDETADDSSGKRRARMMAAVALPSRAAVANNLATALKTLIALERQAFNLGDGSPPDDPATKDDINALIERLDGDQRQQLRAIASAVAGRSGDDPTGT